MSTNLHGPTHDQHSPVYKAQCRTFTLARQMTGNDATATHGSQAEKPPFCLRIVPAYRTARQQTFRDEVARQMRWERFSKELTN